MPAPSQIVPDTSRRDWTADELELLPADGNRYEVIDGELLVSPSPSVAHQIASRELSWLLLNYLVGSGLEVLYAPTAVRFGGASEVEPDVLVLPGPLDRSARYVDRLDRLVLVVEIISPSTARADRHKKRTAYQAHRVADYWIVDVAGRFFERWHPRDEEPEILVDTLTWQPAPERPPLVIDLAAYFGAVHGQ